MKKNIVITGIGIISAIGNDKESVLRSLLKGNSGISEMNHLQSSHHELPVGEVHLSNDEMKEKLNIPLSFTVSRTALLGMMAVGQALEDASLSTVNTEQGRGLILLSGTTVGGMDITEQQFHKLRSADCYPDCLNHHTPYQNTKMIAEHFKVFKDHATISTACSSAANAIILGARLLSSGQADIVVAGGTEALSVFHLNGFNSLMILDHERCRPFDAQRAGLNLGEGAAYVVLESEESAQSRGIEILGYLNGWGNACDAFHQTASSPQGEGAYLAMEQALKEACLSPTDIDYVNAHGTGTPDNDASESQALIRIFQEHIPPISSTKTFTGHTTSASGSIEAVISLLALRHQFIPINLGFKNAMANGIVPFVNEEHGELQHVICNSFGFGGNDASLVLSSTGKTHMEQSTLQHTIQTHPFYEISNEEELMEIRQYVKPMEARRMGRLMKSSLLASLKALELAGIDHPDAIITVTSLGCLENSEQLLIQLDEEGETMLKPTYFMQSTHNTIGSAIAIHTHCHGYNVTYVAPSEWEASTEERLKWALRDAYMLLNTGQAQHVLVGIHDETTPLYRRLLEQGNIRNTLPIHSLSMVLSCTD